MNFRHGPKAVFSYYLICSFPLGPSGVERGKVFYNSESNDGEQFVYVIFLVMPVFKFLFWSFLEPKRRYVRFKDLFAIWGMAGQRRHTNMIPK